MQYDHIFDSSSAGSGKAFEIEDKNNITIFFENEQIVLYADTDGNAVFCTHPFRYTRFAREEFPV